MIFSLSVQAQLNLLSTPIGNGNVNVQVSFTGNASCNYDVTITCPTCTPTTTICTGISNNVACTVTFGLATGSNDISATAVRTSGSGQQCPVTTSASLSVLPIELKKFDLVLHNEQTKLLWSTASETNNDYFTIERSVDGSRFDIIGEINGAGNSQSELAYEFIDKRPVSGINYYRIKQTDFDGMFTYTEIKSVRHKLTTNLSITPLTTEGRLQVNSDLESYSLEVYNIAGQQVKSFNSLSLDQQISIDDLNTGLYFIKINHNGQIETTKVVKI